MKAPFRQLAVLRALVTPLFAGGLLFSAAPTSHACPVTIPNGNPPPGEVPSPDHHGNGALWTVLWPDGTVPFGQGPGEVLADGSLDMKFPWWRAVRGRLQIEGRRLDAAAPPLRAIIPDGYGDIGFQSSGLIFPTVGCWEVTGRVGDASLTFVVTVTLAVPGQAPTITAVVNGASFKPGFASASWVTITGTNLSRSTRTWRSEEIVAGRLPTGLDGVRVNINRRRAFVYYVSPTQINVQAPTDEEGGWWEQEVEVEVLTPDGSVRTQALQRRFAPGLFVFDAEGRRYVAAVHADGTLVGRENLIAGTETRPARPGEVILLYATGMGCATDPAVPAGQVVTTKAALLDQVDATIGGKPADVFFAGLVGAGLYQINVAIPEVPDGDQAVVVQIGEVRSQDGALVTVLR